MSTFLNHDLQLRAAFVFIISKGDNENYIKKILKLIRDNKLYTDKLNKVLNEYNIKPSGRHQRRFIRYAFCLYYLHS